MLRPLLFLSALAGLLSGADGESQMFNMSGCPFPYYGRTYAYLYVTTSASAFTACFNGFYNDSAPGDCITGPPPTNMSSVSVHGPSSAAQSAVRQELPSIVSNLSCYVQLDTPYSGGLNLQMLLNTFGTEAAVSLSSVNSDVYMFNFTVNGKTEDNRTVSNSTGTEYLDVTACRASGQLFRPSTEMVPTPETCTNRSCDEFGVITNTSCGELERCQGNGTCVLHFVCSVIGPALLTVRGGLEYVQDRCEYTLLSVSSDQNLTVTGTFRERRRKDVSFLDRVTLNLSSPVHLEQGGRVVWGGVIQNISSPAQQVLDGVMVSKDQTGVTARVNLSNTLQAVVFFDDYTATITLKGPAQQIVAYGLCDSSTLDEVKLLESGSNCSVLYNDTADSNINCTMMTERCNRLREAPFTTCHPHADPEPYISSCNNTLCRYPAMDGLYCRFLEAYVGVCNMHSNHTLGDWWDDSCSPPRAVCQDKICGDHEFCGYNERGNLGCLCRAIFADPYRSTDSLGGPTVCEQNSSSVTLVGCLLEEKDINYTQLHLNDENCTGHINELDKTVTFGFNTSNTCGAVVMTNNSKMIYKNTIVVDNSSSNAITRQEQVSINFSCYYNLPSNQTTSFKVRRLSIIQDIRSGPYNYSLAMTAYRDASHTQVLEPDTEIQLNQKIWMEVSTGGLEGGFLALIIDSCWATPTSDPTSSPSYNLILNSCANSADGTLEVINNGQGTSANFSLSVFQFSEIYLEVYLHCHLHLCATTVTNCIPTCNGTSRSRRSTTLTYVDDAPGYVSMAWTK